MVDGKKMRLTSLAGPFDLQWKLTKRIKAVILTKDDRRLVFAVFCLPLLVS